MAYDLRTAPNNIIHGHMERHGDGTHYKHAPSDVQPSVWENALGIVDSAQFAKPKTHSEWA